MKIKKFNGFSNVIGSNIRKYRNLRNLTQKQLSDQLALLGVDIYSSDISLIENQKLMIKDFEIIAFAKVLNVTYDMLLDVDDNIFD